jgi:hypothetical protein
MLWVWQVWVWQVWVWQAHVPGLRKDVFPDYQFAGVVKLLLLKL